MSCNAGVEGRIAPKTENRDPITGAGVVDIICTVSYRGYLIPRSSFIARSSLCSDLII